MTLRRAGSQARLASGPPPIASTFPRLELKKENLAEARLGNWKCKSLSMDSLVTGKAFVGRLTADFPASYRAELPPGNPCIAC